MHRSRLASLLLNPSLLSAFVSIVLACLIIGITNWSYIRHDSQLYDYLFGPYGLTTVLQNSSNALSAINGIFSSPIAYNVAVAVFALFIGLLVYVFLEGMDHIGAKTSGAIQEVELITDERQKLAAAHEVGVRLGLRVATLVVWIVYLIFFARVIVPFCILIGRLNIEHYLLTWGNILSVVAGIIMLVIALHVHVIFMRLLVLRPRLFVGDDIMIGRGGHEE